MSLKDLRKKGTSALDATPVRQEPATRRPVTAPGQLMAFRGEMNAAEDRIKALEARVQDLETTGIDVAGVAPNPWQPRRVFDDDEIRKLAGSIAEVGLIQPIIVRRSVGSTNTNPKDPNSVGSTNTNPYQLVAGERRLRAVKLIGQVTIRAIVVEATDEEMASLALAENFDRTDLTAYEIAVAIRNAESAFPNRKSLAACLGVNRSDLYDYLAYFTLPGFVIADLEKTPALIGRAAAKAISVTIKNHGEPAVVKLNGLWPRVRSGDIEQGRIAPAIESALSGSKPAPAPAQRDIRKLFVGEEQAGSITRDAAGLTIKLRAAALTDEQEARLREFVEGLLKAG